MEQHHHKHHHSHHHHHNHSHNKNKKILFLSFSLTLLFACIEMVYGILYQSVALESESLHLLSDSTSMVLSVLALTVGLKAATSKRTFGFKRIKAIAAFLNGISLLLIPIWVLFQAAQRIVHNTPVMGSGMFKIAILGLIINVIVAFVLSRGNRDNLNLKAAFLHVFADLTSSVGVVIVSILVMKFHWYIADPLTSLAVIIFMRCETNTRYFSDGIQFRIFLFFSSKNKLKPMTMEHVFGKIIL